MGFSSIGIPYFVKSAIIVDVYPAHRLVMQLCSVLPNFHCLAPIKVPVLVTRMNKAELQVRQQARGELTTRANPTRAPEIQLRKAETHISFHKKWSPLREC